MTNETISAAAALARELHRGQLTKHGLDYFESHIEGVVSMLQLLFPDCSDEIIAAGYLHDALEDTWATPRSLRDRGISLSSIGWVKEVTRDRSLTYSDWIERLSNSGSIEAVIVKYADNRFNRATMFQLTLDHDRLVERYDQAGRLLEDRLRSEMSQP